MLSQASRYICTGRNFLAAKHSMKQRLPTFLPTRALEIPRVKEISGATRSEVLGQWSGTLRYIEISEWESPENFSFERRFSIS